MQLFPRSLIQGAFVLSQATDPVAVIDALTRAPIYRTTQILQSPSLVPRVKGIYAWWMIHGSVPGLSGVRHPLESDLELLYVGIASRPSSNLLQRLSTHIGGTSRLSTQRLSLASLLAVQNGWNASIVSGRAALSPEFEPSLSDFMSRNLRVSWLAYEDAAAIEHHVIERLLPPLNLYGNASHPQFAYVKAARAAFKASV